MSGLLGAVAFSVARGERTKTLKNLKLAYGGSLSGAQRHQLGREVFHNAAMSLAELAFLYWGRGGNILPQARVEGIDHVLDVLKTGRGAVIVTGHLGNWELIPPLVASRIPCKGGVVARDLSNPGMNRSILRLRQRLGVHVFRRGNSGREYIRFLRDGNVLGILGDIDTKRGDGLFTQFFGRPAWTQRGIAQLALMGNARLIPAFITRSTDDAGVHCLRIEPPLEEPVGAEKDEWIAQMTRAFTDAIEKAVREHPAEWMWMHRRWRHAPGASGEGPKIRPQRARRIRDRV